MVFGEIVEPSTRALIDDDFEEYPEYTKPDLIWQGDFTVPSTLKTLVFIESNKITKLLNAYVLKNDMIHCSLESGELKIYKITNSDFVVLYTKKGLTTGEVVEELANWLRKATNIYALTSDSISIYQNPNLDKKPETLICVLSTEKDPIMNYKKLESPNLVSGLGADVLSFALHTGLRATLFVVYMDNSPLDSININPVLQLCKSLNLPVKSTSLDLNGTPSNLYL